MSSESVGTDAAMSSGEIDAIDRYWRAANYGPAPGISEAGVAGANARESISNSAC